MWWNSGVCVDAVKFGVYASEAAKDFVKLYEWYPMPASVYKILLHGQEIIENHLTPLGQLSEEATESRNKSIRRDHTRKINRVATNTDLMNTLFITSDPFIDSLRKTIPKNRNEPLPQEVVDLLVSVDLENSDSDDDQEEDSD